MDIPILFENDDVVVIDKPSGVMVHAVGGAKLAPDQNFTFQGYVAPSQLATLLAAADIFFMPSLSEGFSMALLEAAATGIPCLVAKTAAPPELSTYANIVTFTTPAEVPELLARISAAYATYNVVDPRIYQFAASRIVPQEAKTIAAAIAGV